MRNPTVKADHVQNTSAIGGTAVQDKLAGAGIPLVVVCGLVHLIAAPEHFEEATYLGLLFLLNFAGSLVAAAGIYRGHRWGWGLGVLVAGGAFVGYVISRTIGLPGMGMDEWLEPLGILSLLVEGLFVGLYLVVSVSSNRVLRWFA
jgi:hypothetical protein